MDTEAGLPGLPLGKTAEGEVLSPKRQRVFMPGPHRSTVLLKDFIHIWQTFFRMATDLLLAPHTSSKTCEVFEKLWDPVLRLSMAGHVVLHESLSEPKIQHEIRISSFNYMITSYVNEWGSRNKVAWATSVLALLNIRVFGWATGIISFYYRVGFLDKSREHIAYLHCWEWGYR